MIITNSLLIGRAGFRSADIPPENSVSITGITTQITGGDSIGNGSNASPASNAYRALLAAAHTWTDTNQCASGRGVWQQIKNIHPLSFTRPQTIIIDGAGLNDIRRSNIQRTFNKIESCCKTLIKKAFSGTNVAAGSASVTRSGSFTAFDAQSLGGVFASGVIPGNVACYNTTANATWTYTFSTGANGIAFVLFSASYPSVNRGNAEVRIDGVLVETITDFKERYDGVSDGANDNQRGPDVRFYFGLSSGSHTIEIKALTADPVVVDQIGIIDTPANTGLYFLLEVPKITDYSIAGLNQANDSYINQVNALRRTCIAPFVARGYKIYYIPIMSTSGGQYNLSGGIDVDGVHPNNTGHDQIFDSIEFRIQ